MVSARIDVVITFVAARMMMLGSRDAGMMLLVIALSELGVEVG